MLPCWRMLHALSDSQSSMVLLLPSGLGKDREGKVALCSLSGTNDQRPSKDHEYRRLLASHCSGEEGIASLIELHSVSSAFDLRPASSTKGDPLRSSWRVRSSQRIGLSLCWGRLCRKGCHDDDWPCRLMSNWGSAMVRLYALKDFKPTKKGVGRREGEKIMSTLLLFSISQRAKHTSSLRPSVSCAIELSELASVAVIPRSALSSKMTYKYAPICRNIIIIIITGICPALNSVNLNVTKQLRWDHRTSLIVFLCLSGKKDAALL